MFEPADVRDWRGHNVVDAESHKIGELGAVNVDTGTDLPSFGSVNEEAVFKYYGLTYEPGAGAQRRPAAAEPLD